jgi:hypothetical protein
LTTGLRHRQRLPSIHVFAISKLGLDQAATIEAAWPGARKPSRIPRSREQLRLGRRYLLQVVECNEPPIRPTETEADGPSFRAPGADEAPPHAAGCDEVFVETASGIRTDRPKLAKAIEQDRQRGVLGGWIGWRGLRHLIERGRSEPAWRGAQVPVKGATSGRPSSRRSARIAVNDVTFDNFRWIGEHLL